MATYMPLVWRWPSWAVLLVLSMLGCWSLESWLPQDFPQHDFRKAFQLPLPADAAVFQLCDITLSQAPRQVLQAIWDDADEQVIAAHLRPLLRANGFRIGVLARGYGNRWPPTVMPASPPPKLFQLLLRPGKNHFVPMGDPVVYLACPIYYAGESCVAEFSQAQGGLLVEMIDWQRDGVGLRVEPVIRHQQTDPTRLLWPTQSAWPLTVQHSETRFPFLAASITLRPQETLLLGANHENDRALGCILFEDPDHKQTHLISLSFLGGPEALRPGSKSNTLFPQPVTQLHGNDMPGPP